jgi:hypothetical protein
MPEYDDSRLVTVCDACLMAACWQGKFMCQESRGAGTLKLPISELRKLNREHSDFWSVKADAGDE